MRTSGRGWLGLEQQPGLDPRGTTRTEEWDRGRATDIAFDDWERSQACPLENMELVNVRIANWRGVGPFDPTTGLI
jgi:hypothetical protein